MRVNIGPYIKWIGPYQIAEKILFWKDEDSQDEVHRFGTWLANNSKGEDSYLMKFCQYLHNKKARKVQVKVHKYDTWNADSTLALIILPLLKEIKKNRRGSGFVDLEDVPEHLRFSTADEYDTQRPFEFYQETKPKGCNYPSVHTRYEWLLNEIIWTFEMYQKDDLWELDKVQEERLQKGLVLFGKYYRNLWT